MIDVEKIEAWIGRQRTFWSDLVTTDDGTPAVFEDLARRSAPYLKEFMFPRWDATSAWTPSSRWNHTEDMPCDLLAEWDAYADRWREFLEINPALRLAELLSDVSETHDASSFPAGWEDAIREWVVSDFAGERPFDDRNGYDTPDWRERFAETAKAMDGDWIYYGDQVYVLTRRPAPVAAPLISP